MLLHCCLWQRIGRYDSVSFTSYTTVLVLHHITCNKMDLAKAVWELHPQPSWVKIISLGSVDHEIHGYLLVLVNSTS